MSARVLKYTVVVRHPESFTPVALVAGQPLPKWAKDLVHADDLVEGDGTDADQSAEATSKWEAEKVADLKAEIEKRNADRDPEGDGYITPEEPGNKPELVAALVADDKAQQDA